MGLRQIFPLVGAYFGGHIGFAIGAIIGNLVDPERIKGPRLDELPVTGTTEGAHRAVVYGTCVVRNCQLIDWGPLEDETVDEQQGKGLGPVVETQRLSQTYAIGIGEGPITGIRYIKRDGKMVYDVRPGSAIMAESAKYAQKMRVYLGGEGQMPDPDLEAIHGVGETPYYRGTAYFVMVRDDLTDGGGRIPTYEVEVTREGVAAPVETVDMVDFHDQAETGFIPSNQVWIREETVDARAFMSAAPTTLTPEAPSRVRIYASEASGGALIYDSGWIGNTSEQLDLDLAMADVTELRYELDSGDEIVTDPTEIALFRLGLTGAILGPTVDEESFVPPYATDTMRVQLIRPWNLSGASVQSRVIVAEPDPVEVTEPYIALPEVPGAIYGLTTGTTWFTPFADGVGEVDEAGVTLSEVIADICDRCGIPAASLDLSALDADVVDGVTLGGAYSGADAIRMFMPAYFFDIVQPEKVLLAVKRGGAVKATITEADFVEAPDENVLRGQDIEYPRQLLLKYLNPGQNYAAPAAAASRTSPDARVTGDVTMELPIAMLETPAKRVADRILKVMWEDLNGEVTFSLPAGPFAWLTPTDCLGLSLRGGLYRIRVENVEESAGILTVTARRDRQSAYTSTLTAIPLPEPEGPPASLAGPTILRVLNMPGIIYGDDRLDGATWITLGTYTSRSVMGTLANTLPYASPLVTDWVNPLNVTLFDDTVLESATELELQQGANAAAIIKPDGTVEIVQYLTATDGGNRLWSLWEKLLRGRLDTTPIEHAVGAMFVTLESTVFVELPPSAIGSEILFRAVSAGTSPETAAQIAFTWNPVVAQTEFAPYELEAERDAGTLSIEWMPRHRFGTELAPIASEMFDGFRVTVTDGTTTAVNTLPRGALPEIEMSDAAFSGPVDITVEPLNRITGANAGAELTGID
jgi:hypothetical protein